MGVKEIAGVYLPEDLEFHSPTDASVTSEETLEPYTTEKLRRIPGGYKALTEHFQMVTINFNNVQVTLCTENAENIQIIIGPEIHQDRMCIFSCTIPHISLPC